MTSQQEIDGMLFSGTSSGTQVLITPQLMVSFVSEFTHLYRLENRITSSNFYSATFGANKVLQYLQINVLKSAVSMSLVRERLGLSETDEDDTVRNVLASHFPVTDMVFVRMPSKRPTRVGALITSVDSTILFCFGLRRGALRSSALRSDILNSVKIEVSSPSV